MKLALDHFFILVEPDAKVADLLVDFGLEESYRRLHEGQGTSNRCFKFSNSMMELLWLRDEQEAHNGPANGLKFPQRSANREASPFGLILNRQESSDLQMPFNGWSYQPDYFPAPMAFHVASNSENLIEPLCIYIPFLDPAEKQVDRASEKGQFKSISHVHVNVPLTSLSEELVIAAQADGLSIECGTEHLMEITFDQKACGLSKDLRPGLPLILHW
jgi:hypothetical protein